MDKPAMPKPQAGTWHGPFAEDIKMTPKKTKQAQRVSKSSMFLAAISLTGLPSGILAETPIVQSQSRVEVGHAQFPPQETADGLSRSYTTAISSASRSSEGASASVRVTADRKTWQIRTDWHLFDSDSIPDGAFAKARSLNSLIFDELLFLNPGVPPFGRYTVELKFKGLVANNAPSTGQALELRSQLFLTLHLGSRTYHSLTMINSNKGGEVSTERIFPVELTGPSNSLLVQMNGGMRADMFDEAGLVSLPSATGNTLHSLEVILPPGVSCIAMGSSFPGCEPPLPPCSSTTDSDLDGILDSWEETGIDLDCDGTIDLELYDENGDGVVQASERPDSQRKDVYVEMDWMDGFEPSRGALEAVTNAFAKAPVDCDENGNCKGIRLHLLKSESFVPLTGVHFDSVKRSPPKDASILDFFDLKSTLFGNAPERARPLALQAKRQVFRFMLFANHNLTDGLAAGPSLPGVAEIPGNDILITLGAHQSSIEIQSAVIMHELGHSLGLYHGGGFGEPNCKPNYISVMNFSFEFRNPVVDRKLDFSRVTLPTLKENALDENLGVNGGVPMDQLASVKTTFGPSSSSYPVVSANGAIDWNQNGTNTDNPAPLSPDINDLSSAYPDCTGEGTIHQGFNDWENLLYNFRGAESFSDGPSADPNFPSITIPRELTIAEVTMASPDGDGDSVADAFDNCIGVFNPDQSDVDENAVGDLCDGPIFFDGFESGDTSIWSSASTN